MVNAGKLRREIPISLADITDLEKKRVMDVLGTNFLSRGPAIREFEERLSDYLKVPYVIAVNSGTSALHLSVKSLGIKEGDEVITTPFSFVSSSTCLLMERAKPVFVDIDPNTYNINPSLIKDKVTSKTKAILPADVFGYPCDMDEINAIADKYGLPVIEDSCEALGARYKGDIVGRNSTLSVLSFFPNKQITTGEGGAIMTSQKDLAELCRSIRNHGKTESALSYTERLGYNYWMNEMNAALGVAQLERIDEILEKRKTLSEMYMQKLKHLDGIILPNLDDKDHQRSWFVFVIRTPEKDRDNVLSQLREQGIGCKEYFPVIHLQPLYAREFGYKEGDFPVAEKIARQTIALPFYNNLKEEDINYIASKLEQAL